MTARMRGITCVVLTALAMGGSVIAAPNQIQATAPPVKPLPPATIAPCRDTAGTDLAHSCGVITPPATGDTGVVAAPDKGTMPVVPPPGTPGGDPSVQPK